MGLRGMATYAPATTWEAPEGRNLLGASVTIVGGGGIAEVARPAAATVRGPDHRRPADRRHRSRARTAP